MNGAVLVPFRHKDIRQTVAADTVVRPTVQDFRQGVHIVPVDFCGVERQRHEIPERRRQTDVAHLRRCTPHTAFLIRGGVRRRMGPLRGPLRLRRGRRGVTGPECALARFKAGHGPEDRLAACHDFECAGGAWIPLYAAERARIGRAHRHPRTPCRRRMQRRQVAETANGFRFHEGTRERCFAPIRERQILRHDVNLSRYQVEGCGPGAIACGRASLRRDEGAPRSGRPPSVGRRVALGLPFAPKVRLLPGGGRRAAHRRAAVVARSPFSRSMGEPRSLRRVGSLRAFVLSSSNVPSWVVARLLGVWSGAVAFRR